MYLIQFVLNFQTVQPSHSKTSTCDVLTFCFDQYLCAGFEFCTKIRYRASQDTQDKRGVGTRSHERNAGRLVLARSKAEWFVSLPKEGGNGNQEAMRRFGSQPTLSL